MIMKYGIFIALAALALAVVAVPEAYGSQGRGLKLRVAGSNVITSSQDDGTPSPLGGVFTALQSGIVQGAGGGVFTSQTVVDQAGLDPGCEAPLLFGAGFIFLRIVVTDNDGSILTLQGSEDSFYCTDGVAFVANLVGTVLEGRGRYEGATGTWDGSVDTSNSSLTGSLTVELD
jgi:hypothetical protein